MKRGEIWWVSFDPAVGSEIQKTRPAIVVSNDAANASMPRVQVIPITSNVTRLYRFEAHLTIDGKPGKAMADQIMTADKSRLKNKIGTLSRQELTDVERAIRLQLGL